MRSAAAAGAAAVAVVLAGCAGDESPGEPYSVRDVVAALEDAGVPLSRAITFPEPRQTGGEQDEVVGWVDADPVFFAVYPDEASARGREQRAQGLDPAALVDRRGNVMLLVDEDEASPDEIGRARAALAALG